jgi:hypothetical protein
MALIAVNLKTDFRRSEFAVVEVHLRKWYRRARMQPQYLDFLTAPAGDFTRGVRVAEVYDLEAGTYRLMIRLLDGRGAPIAMARSSVSLSRDTVANIVIAR